MVDRKKIVEKLASKLKNDSLVFAMWLEGADANDLVDEYSDLDIWFDVEDGQEKKMMKKITKILESFGELDFSCNKNNPHPKILEYVFHIKKSSPFLLIEVAVQSSSRNFDFIEEFEHEKPKLIFDKADVIKYSKLNEKEWDKELAIDLEQLKNVFKQQSRVKVKRGKFLETYDSYLKWTIEPLIKMLRIKYCPLKKDYGFKHLDRDLPENITKKIRSLLFIGDILDIEIKQKMAEKWFWKLIGE